jgi:hypothetical protein
LRRSAALRATGGEDWVEVGRGVGVGVGVGVEGPEDTARGVGAMVASAERMPSMAEEAEAAPSREAVEGRYEIDWDPR